MSAVIRFYELASRPMAEADLAAVVAIERAAYAFPWTHGIFRDCLRVGYRCTVFERCGVIDAYTVVSVVAGECHILNLCVRPLCQGRGIGRMVLEQLLERARQLGTETAFLEVRPTNRAAIKLYSAFGFNEIGVRRSYYPAARGREDALIMALTL